MSITFLTTALIILPDIKEILKGIFMPAYNELMVCYNPVEISFRRLLDTLYLIENKPVFIPSTVRAGGS